MRTRLPSRKKAWIAGPACLCLLWLSACQPPPERTGRELAFARELQEQKTERDVMVIETDYGDIVMVFNRKAARNHVVKIQDLVKNGFYDGLTFHLIQPGLLIQGGDINTRDDDPENDGFGDPGFFIPAEPGAPHIRGSVGLAHPAGEPNAGNSQFYICLTRIPKLDGRYTVFGQVVEGLDVVDKISQVPLDEHGRPLKPVVMKRVYIERRVVAPLPLLPAS